MTSVMPDTLKEKPDLNTMVRKFMHLLCLKVKGPNNLLCTTPGSFSPFFTFGFVSFLYWVCCCCWFCFIPNFFEYICHWLLTDIANTSTHNATPRNSNCLLQEDINQHAISLHTTDMRKLRICYEF